MSLVDRAVRASAWPVPYRALILRKLLRRWPLGSYPTRLMLSAVDRPNYGWCSYHAAEEARALGYKAMTVVEFGVAAGNGLVCLCKHKKDIRKELGIEILVVGFDTGTGLPPSQDPRDLLYFWPPGSFEMDRAALEKRIDGQAELVLGNVADTVASWRPREDAPIGAIMFDLDFYSSTMAAFGIFDQSNILPRVWCYFDDISGYPGNAYTDHIGEREAIKEFNQAAERQLQNDHLSPAYVFKGIPVEPWHQDIYLYHRLKHPSYNICLSKEDKQQLHLS
jgi:hypothetical protein